MKNPLLLRTFFFNFQIFFSFSNYFFLKCFLKKNSIATTDFLSNSSFSNQWQLRKSFYWKENKSLLLRKGHCCLSIIVFPQQATVFLSNSSSFSNSELFLSNSELFPQQQQFVLSNSCFSIGLVALPQTQLLFHNNNGSSLATVTFTQQQLLFLSNSDLSLATKVCSLQQKLFFNYHWLEKLLLLRKSIVAMEICCC